MSGVLDPEPERAVVVDVDAPTPGAIAPTSELADRMRSVISQGYQLILLNVADLTYCDSVTLGAIVQAYSAAIRGGAHVKLIHVTRRVRELLTMTKLDKVIESVDDLET
jgi:anti-sigma B factor antagonist